MKKVLKYGLITLAAIAVSFTIIHLFESDISTDSEGSFEVVLINIDNEEVTRKVINYKKTDNLFELIKSNFNVKYEDSQYGAYITSIDSLSSSSDVFISIIVNDEISQVGITAIQLQDKMVLKLVETKIEW